MGTPWNSLRGTSQAARERSFRLHGARVKSQLGRRWMFYQTFKCQSQKKNPAIMGIGWQPKWLSQLNGAKNICKNILFFSLTFTFCRLCQCGLGGNEAAFANTSSIHFKSSQRQKCQISIWIKCARVWFIYSLKSIISFCKPNITNCLETSKEFLIILEENRFLFWDTVLNWIQSE